MQAYWNLLLIPISAVMLLLVVWLIDIIKNGITITINDKTLSAIQDIVKYEGLFPDTPDNDGSNSLVDC